MNESFLRSLSKKIDALLWVFSVPLLPVIIAEFFIELSEIEQIYFAAYYFILWFVFTFEFPLRLYLARDKAEYFKTNWLDVLVVLTSAFRVFKVFSFIRFPVLLLSDRVLRGLGAIGMNFLYYLIFVVVIVLVGADLVLFFEQQDPASRITTFREATWWALNYLTTTGSAVYDVTTTGGRVVGAALMTLGFAIFSILIASVVSFFMREHARTSPDENLLKDIKGHLGLDQVIDQLERIEKKIDRNSHG